MHLSRHVCRLVLDKIPSAVISYVGWIAWLFFSFCQP